MLKFRSLRPSVADIDTLTNVKGNATGSVFDLVTCFTCNSIGGGGCKFGGEESVMPWTGAMHGGVPLLGGHV